MKYYFAGGGTGGHIYPAIAVAERIRELDEQAQITFFCSNRALDSAILAKSKFIYVPLPQEPFIATPKGILKFYTSYFKSRRLASVEITPDGGVMVGVGGFVSFAPAKIAHRRSVPVVMINVDSVPGKANKALARYARIIFAQFEITRKHFGRRKRKVMITGAPLRKIFDQPHPQAVIAELGLDSRKKTLLVDGGSGGAVNINNTVAYLLEKLEGFAGQWQIVHIAGVAHYDGVSSLYANVKIKHKVLSYYDDKASLLAAAELVIGRAGAMSVAEYAATGTPCICLPYPYHKDNHQRLNAEVLVEAGCCEIVDDLCDTEKTARALWPVLSGLMTNDEKLLQMSRNCEKIAVKNAAMTIASIIVQIARERQIKK